MEAQRHHLILSELEIDIDLAHNKITLADPSRMPKLDFIAVDPDAIYFRGSIEQFIDMLGRMKKKYGHLYE